MKNKLILVFDKIWFLWISFFYAEFSKCVFFLIFIGTHLWTTFEANRFPPVLRIFQCLGNQTYTALWISSLCVTQSLASTIFDQDGGWLCNLISKFSEIYRTIKVYKWIYTEWDINTWPLIYFFLRNTKTLCLYNVEEQKLSWDSWDDHPHWSSQRGRECIAMSLKVIWMRFFCRRLLTGRIS